jgi:Type VI secretion system VasI, EvfG, VC_A0118
MSDHHLPGTQHCPSCAAPVASVARICWTCGHELVVNETAQAAQPEESDQIPLVDWKSSEAPAPTVQVREAGPAKQGKSWSLALIGGAGVLACVVAMVALQSLRPVASEQPIEATRPASPAPVAAAPVVESAPAPTWVGNRQATWANDGSKTVSFELKASNDVTVWMARVRPLLVVRCLYRTTEVFVAIKSSASIEGQAGSHTVRLQVDDAPELVQHWTDSVTGQELFAPGGVDLVRRLASAERLRFSFTPYNAKPVTAEFSVQGFENMAALVGSTCGWKLDDSRSQSVRTARLN